MSGIPIAIGSRGSALALAQAGLVEEALQREGRSTRMVLIETAGDRRAPDTAWGEGAFVAAIETALLDGRIDVAVHSAKDMPTDQDPRLTIGAYLPRADPRDALVVRAGAEARTLASLPAGTRIGTDSPRRAGFVRARRPDLTVHPLHGNVDTRLRRLDEGQTDALILACAGLDRMGLGDRIDERFGPEIIPPAAGQGAIAVQIRRDHARMLALAAAIDDRRSRLAVEAERAFLAASGGGCRAPIGALATVADGELRLLAGVASPDGSWMSFGRRRGPLDSGPELARDLAIELANAAGRASAGDDADSIGWSAPRRVLVTRAVAQADRLTSALRDAGLDPVLVPSIAVEIAAGQADLERAAGRLETYRWVVMTSANGAAAILGSATRRPPDPGDPSWAAIGPASAAALEEEGVAVRFSPSRATASTMAAELPIDPGDRVLVVRGDLADGELAAALRVRGAEVDDVIAYRTHEAPESSRGLLRHALQHAVPDAVVFTSGSTVRGLLALARADALHVTTIPAVCIGPETAREATRAGFRVVATSPRRDVTTLARTTAVALGRPPQEIA
ncbi:MAG: hypothetical protein NVS9B8_05960 [Candidatus Limnocylindrales bacterium]